MIKNNKLGIHSWFGYNYPFEERIKLIKDTGFQYTMTWWGDEGREKNEPKEIEPDIVRKHGLIIENTHFSFIGINNIWEDTLDGKEIFNIYLSYIDDCKKHEIPMAVMHVTNGINPPPYGELGLNRFKKIIEKAEKNNVTIALENLLRPEYLDYIFDNIKSDKLKFCYDSGHENCLMSGIKFLEKYKDKLAALHLHDNNGLSDQHLLPFSGTINWGDIIDRLKDINYKGVFSLELDAQSNNVVNHYTASDYLSEAINIAYKLLSM